MLKSFFIAFLFFLFSLSAKSSPVNYVDFVLADSGVVNLTMVEQTLGDENMSRPNPVRHWLRKQQKKNKKITAAILAFPFPFGIVGLHRIYLGCAPYVPVVYIASLGGAFGILPFIDFCVIVMEKDIDRFINNDKVFMWVK